MKASKKKLIRKYRKRNLEPKVVMTILNVIGRIAGVPKTYMTKRGVLGYDFGNSIWPIDGVQIKTPFHLANEIYWYFEPPRGSPVEEWLNSLSRVAVGDPVEEEAEEAEEEDDGIPYGAIGLPESPIIISIFIVNLCNKRMNSPDMSWDKLFAEVRKETNDIVANMEPATLSTISANANNELRQMLIKHFKENRSDIPNKQFDKDELWEIISLGYEDIFQKNINKIFDSDDEDEIPEIENKLTKYFDEVKKISTRLDVGK